MTLMLKGAVMALFLILATAAGAQLQFDRQELVIETRDGKRHVFEVELALTAEQRAQGLMRRENMPLDHGMLFDFDDTRPVSMWMQNTPLPLDMLFIQKDGTISHIHKMAEPFSRAIIDSRGPVSFVLELNGGRSDALGITSGDRVVSQ